MSCKTNIVLPECPPTEAYTLQTDEHNLTFIPPHDARVLIDPKKREVRFYYRDDRCLIILRHGDVSPALVSPEPWDKLRDIVRERYPDAEVSEGSACQNSCGARGCGFTIRRKTGYGNLTVMTRLSFIPVEGGTLEVSMAAADHKFPAQLAAFRNFLNCLRLEQKDNAKVRLAGIEGAIWAHKDVRATGVLKPSFARIRGQADFDLAISSRTLASSPERPECRKSRCPDSKSPACRKPPAGGTQGHHPHAGSRPGAG